MADDPSSNRTPPASSFTTLVNFLDDFKGDVEIPSHIDKSVFPSSMSGGNQSYLMHALKFMGLISENGIPENCFQILAKGNVPQKASMWRSLVQSAYAFVFEDLEIERTTSSIVIDRFRSQGISGDTVRKAITFFLHACKQAGIKISPHVKAPRPANRVAGAKSTKSRKQKSEQKREHQVGEPKGGSIQTDQQANKTPYEILIEILSAEMTDEEQEAVWSLIRYLKKKELSE